MAISFSGMGVQFTNSGIPRGIFCRVENLEKFPAGINVRYRRQVSFEIPDGVPAAGIFCRVENLEKFPADINVRYRRQVSFEIPDGVPAAGIFQLLND